MAPDIHRLIGQNEEAAQRIYKLKNDLSDKKKKNMSLSCQKHLMLQTEISNLNRTAHRI